MNFRDLAKKWWFWLAVIAVLCMTVFRGSVKKALGV
jgi:hypothetical protein